MLFNALQLGVRVDLSDLAFHTFMDLSDFAGKVYGGKEAVKPMSLSELRKNGITRG